jgi:hypothetical protein
MTQRKIIQIATAGLSDNDSSLLALAEDGTLWELDYTLKDCWRQIPPLPKQQQQEV